MPTLGLWKIVAIIGFFTVFAICVGLNVHPRSMKFRGEGSSKAMRIAGKASPLP